MESLFKKEWAAIERDETRPRRLRNYVRIPFAEIKRRTLAQDPEFVRQTVNSLYAGDVLVLQGAYPTGFIEDIKVKAFEWGKQRPSSFHKMLGRTPDFHRIIDESLAHKYSMESIRHMYYFFRWNDDPLGLMDQVYDKWRVIKLIGGFDFDQYENNTPDDGVVDRIIIAHYPSGTGELETHSDPYKFQRTIMGTKMSIRGIDYQEGGLYFVDDKGNEVDIENNIDLGDMYLSYATVLHGVRTIDPGQPTDWNSIKGRWFLGLYSAASDVPKDRHTGYGVTKSEYLGKAYENSATPTTVG